MLNHWATSLILSTSTKANRYRLQKLQYFGPKSNELSKLPKTVRNRPIWSRYYLFLLKMDCVKFSELLPGPETSKLAAEKGFAKRVVAVRGHVRGKWRCTWPLEANAQQQRQPSAASGLVGMRTWMRWEKGAASGLLLQE